MIRISKVSAAGLVLGLVLALAAKAHDAVPVPLPRAHAHNDYEHDRPLFDALAHGVCSVEADIHLVDGALLVAHDPDEVEPGKTLEGLYLDPLQQHVEKNGGTVYPNGPAFTLLIDIKTEAEATYAALREKLQPYRAMLTRFTPASTEEKAVTAIVSGNRPIATMREEAIRLAAVDGRLPNLLGSPNPHVMPLVSASWNSAFRWRGIGEMPAPQRKRLEDLVGRAHANGQRIRFWGLPRPSELWPVLYEAGVDLLNADDLAAIQRFLLEQREQPAE